MDIIIMYSHNRIVYSVLLCVLFVAVGCLAKQSVSNLRYQHPPQHHASPKKYIKTRQDINGYSSQYAFDKSKIDNQRQRQTVQPSPHRPTHDNIDKHTVSPPMVEAEISASSDVDIQVMEDVTYDASSKIRSYSRDIVTRYQATAMRVTADEAMMVSNATIYGYIAGYEFQNDDQCAEQPSNINVFALRQCIGIYDSGQTYNYYYSSNALNASLDRIYATLTLNQAPQPGDDSLYASSTYYYDDTCVNATGYVDMFYLPTTCDPVNDTILPTSSYFMYSSTIIDQFPSDGSLDTVYVPGSNCQGEVLEVAWYSPQYCFASETRGSFTKSCYGNPYLTIAQSNLYYDIYCTVFNQQVNSSYVAGCYDDPTTIAVLKTCYGYPTSHNCINASQLMYDPYGDVSIMETFQQCLENIGGDGPFFPGYSTGGQTEVSVSVSLDNLIEVNEVTNSVTLDFFLNLQWPDPRIHMPVLFAALQVSAIDVTPAIGQQNIFGAQTDFWLPDVLFPDAQDVFVSDQFIRLLDNGQVLWMQHIVITLIQSSFHYEEYPTDTQYVYLRMYSFSLFADQIAFTPVYVDYQYAESGEYSIALNPVWKFQAADGHGGAASPGTYYAARTYAVITIKFSRISNGIVIRLALPMFLLVMLAALSFWADITDRVNSTVTMLLAISALYIVVIQNIPPIGYLTNFDYFVVIMFIILFACCILHLLTVRLSKDTKLEKWPIRKFYIRLLEFVGRIVVIPTITGLYLFFFREASDHQTVYMSALFVSIFIAAVFVREFFSTRTAFLDAMHAIESKADALSDVSTAEVVLFNLYMYRMFARTLRHHIRILAKRQRMEQANNPDDVMASSVISGGVEMGSVYSVQSPFEADYEEKL